MYKVQSIIPYVDLRIDRGRFYIEKIYIDSNKSLNIISHLDYSLFKEIENDIYTEYMEFTNKFTSGSIDAFPVGEIDISIELEENKNNELSVYLCPTDEDKNYIDITLPFSIEYPLSFDELEEEFKDLYMPQENEDYKSWEQSISDETGIPLQGPF